MLVCYYYSFNVKLSWKKNCIWHRYPWAQKMLLWPDLAGLSWWWIKQITTENENSNKSVLSWGYEKSGVEEKRW